MWEVLIVPKSASLFLINLDDVFVLHPQLTGTQHRTQNIEHGQNYKIYYILIF